MTESKRMKTRPAVAALAGLLVLGAGAGWALLWPEVVADPVSEQPRAASSVVEPGPSTLAAVALPAPAGAAGNWALQLQRLLSVSPIGEEDRLPANDAQKAAWEAREGLRDALRKDPASWTDLLDLLACSDSLALSQEVVKLGRVTVEDPAEQVLLSLLKTRHHAQLRQLVLTALARRDTKRALEACSLVSRDEDAGVRLAALYGLAGLRDRNPSGELHGEADQLIRRFAQEERAPELRRPALLLSGEPVVADARPTPPSKGFRRGFVVSR
jgi:hypothetical protein